MRVLLFDDVTGSRKACARLGRFTRRPHARRTAWATTLGRIRRHVATTRRLLRTLGRRVRRGTTGIHITQRRQVHVTAPFGHQLLKAQRHGLGGQRRGTTSTDSAPGQTNGATSDPASTTGATASQKSRGGDFHSATYSLFTRPRSRAPTSAWMENRPSSVANGEQSGGETGCTSPAPGADSGNVTRTTEDTPGKFATNQKPGFRPRCHTPN